MLQWLRGELPSPHGDRVYLTRPVADPGFERGFMHPGRWKVYGDYGVVDYPDAEAILDDGWTVI